MMIEDNLVVRFYTAMVDVIFLGKHTPIPMPLMMRNAAAYVTLVLTTLFPKGVAYVDLTEESLALAILATIFPPLVWNIIGPFEYYTRAVSTVVRKPIIGVYLSALIIATLSVFRSALFIAAVRDQPLLETLDTPLWNATAGAVFVIGLIFFIAAYLRLGISGTYLGDYFGIFRKERITSFPFNVLGNPMYDGSSLFHFGEAMLNHKPAGMMMAGWLFVCYRIGCIFEEPFTARLYAERDERRKEGMLADGKSKSS